MSKLRRPVINKLQPLDAQLQNYLDQLVADINDALRTTTSEPSSLRDYVTVDYLNRHVVPAIKKEVKRATAPTPPPPIATLTAAIDQPSEEWYLKVTDWTSANDDGSIEMDMRLYDGSDPITSWISLGERDFNDKPAQFGPFAGSAIAFTVKVRARHVVDGLASPWTEFNASGTYVPAAGPTLPTLPTSLTLAAQAHTKDAYILFTLLWTGGSGVLGAAVYDQYGTQVTNTTINAASGTYTFWPVLKPESITTFYGRVYLLEDPSQYIQSNQVSVGPPAPPVSPTSLTLTVDTTSTQYRFVVSLANPSDVPDWYEVESQVLFKDAVEDPWKPIGGLDPALGSLTTDWWPRPVETRSAQVRARSIHPQGIRGDWVYSNFADIPGATIAPPGAAPSVNAPTITYNGNRYSITSSWSAVTGAEDYEVWAIFYLPSGVLESEILLGYTWETSLVSGEWPRPTLRYNVATKVVPRNVQGIKGPATTSSTSVLNPSADPAVAAVTLSTPTEERSGVPHFQISLTITIPDDLSPSWYKAEARYYSDAAGANPVSDWILLGSIEGLTHKTDWWPCPTSTQYVRVRVSPEYDDKWAYSAVVAVPTGKLNLATVQPASVGPGLTTTPNGIQINPGQGLDLSGAQVIIPNAAITTPLIAANAVDTSKIANGAITTPLIAENAVDTSKIMDAAVNDLKIVNGAITSGKLADGAVTTGKIANDAVDSDKIADGAVRTEHILAGAITAPLIAAGAIDTTKIMDNAITNLKIVNEAITTGKLIDGAVTSDKIADGAVTTGKIVAGAITNPLIAAGAVDTSKIMDGAITDLKIVNAAITADKLADGAVVSVKLANGSVVTGKLADSAVNADKLANGAVISVKLADGSVVTGKLADSAVTSAKIGANAVLTAHIAPGAITTPLIAAGAIDTSKLMNDAVTNLKIVNGAITSTKLADSAITSEKLANSAVTYGKIANDAIGTAAIADGAVLSGKIATGAILAGHIAAGAIATNHIAAGAVTADVIAANAITTDKIAANAVTSIKIAAGAVATDHLAAGAVTADKIAANSITSDKIAANSILGSDIAAGAIATNHLAAGIVTSDKIAAAAVLASHIAAGAIATNHLAAGAITASIVVVGSSNPFGGTVYVNGSINVDIGDLTFASGASGRIYCKEVSASGTVSGYTVYATQSTIYTLNVSNTLQAYFASINNLVVTSGGWCDVYSPITFHAGVALPSSTTVGGAAFGQAAFRNVGTGSTEVAAGDHTHTLNVTTTTIRWEDEAQNVYYTDVVTGVSIS